MLSDQCLPPNGHERIPFFDLRQAMMQLQFGLTDQIPQRGCAKKYGTPDEDEKKDDLQLMTERMEVISFSDAFIDIRPRVLMEVSSSSISNKYITSADASLYKLYDVDKLQPTSDEELDVAALLKPEMYETYPILAMIDRSSDIAGSLVQAVGGHLPPFGDLGLARLVSSNRKNYEFMLTPNEGPSTSAPCSPYLTPSSLYRNLYCPIQLFSFIPSLQCKVFFPLTTSLRRLSSKLPIEATSELIRERGSLCAG